MNIKQIDLSKCDFGTECILGHVNYPPDFFSKKLGIVFSYIDISDVGSTEVAYLVCEDVRFVLFRYLNSPRPEYTAIAVSMKNSGISKSLNIIMKGLGVSTNDMIDFHPDYSF